MLEPLWLNLARKELGTKEAPGGADNPVVLKYAEDAEIAGVVNQDSVAWCAAFVGAMLARAQTPGSKRANARSYETWGRKIISPCLGCVVVFSRPPSTWMGHVAFYLGTNAAAKTVRVLGGNQGDAVSIAEFSRDRVVAYRWPTSGLIQPEWVGPLPVSGAGAEVNPKAS
jgi:uncharacterized protein (TIGR02594 family)